VVHSIAAIPDAITRTVYMKECSRLMNIEEEVLSLEVAKLRRKKWQEGAARKPADGAQEALPAENEAETISPTTSLRPSADDVYTEATEKELVYYLLKFGDRKLPLKNEGTELVSVAEYIFSELQKDDLELKNVHYRRLFDEYSHVLALPNEEERQKYFINHPDKNVMAVAIDLLSDHYNLTIKRFVQSEEPEDSKLTTDIPRAMLIYKSNVAKQQYVEMSNRLRDAKSEEDVELVRERLFVLQGIRKDFSNELRRLTT
jgi:DNA primase